MAGAVEYPDPCAIRARFEADCRLSVRVTPNAKANAILLSPDDAIAPQVQIRVTAPPEDGKANAAAIALLAKALGIGKSAISIVQGKTARNKLFEIRG